ncbi:hypothetical protein IWQ62_000361 [Dispira parvispora]|uniref:Protein with SprT-like domain at the N terminus n=1 Tax=Dispira parvispora TaxID=1520584 RepID=A0A9W8AX59_9FUNG|nr:hypothetical protein IWQ62_000361 [Dispira parvispora]
MGDSVDFEIPDVYALFQDFNRRYFGSKLGSVEVKWSYKMRLCGGVCSYQPRDGYCCIRLSEPLLKFRPVSDLVNTLLHEMIHAYLFLTGGNHSRDGHGPEFQHHMKRINDIHGSRITIYHSFHDEVDYYRTHIWRCGGPCQNRPPYFGIVKRSMNRPPQSADSWYAEHQRTCGGTFEKIAEPEKKPPAKRKSTLPSSSTAGRTLGRPPNDWQLGTSHQGKNITELPAQPTLARLWAARPDKSRKIGVDSESLAKTPTPETPQDSSLAKTEAQGHTNTDPISTVIDLTTADVTSPKPNGKIPSCSTTDLEITRVIESTYSIPTSVICPVCNMSGIALETINSHLDLCLG